MPKNPPEGTQRIVPYLAYADANQAVEFLTRVFGFVERMRLTLPDGGVAHAELAYGDAVVWLANGVQGFGSPRDLPHRHALICCYVDDVEAHYAHAKQAGAEIIEELQDKFYGDRTYAASDSEGNHWHFAQHVRDVPVEEIQAAIQE